MTAQPIAARWAWAKAADIGDLAHELEFLYELLAAGRLPPSAALFALLQNCHDRLAHMLDAVRLGQPLHAATALIDYIRNFSSAALTDISSDSGMYGMTMSRPRSAAGNTLRSGSRRPFAMASGAGISDGSRHMLVMRSLPALLVRMITVFLKSM